MHKCIIEWRPSVDKEKILTIGIGLAVGISAAATYFIVIHFLPGRSTNQATFSPQTAPKSKQLAISLTGPDDHIATTAATITFSGQTQTEAKLIFFANADEKVASADAQGNFSADINLEQGKNIISLTALDKFGNTMVVKRDITQEISQ